MSVRAAYPLWAATYEAETPVSTLEDAAVRALTPALTGKAVLDAACGTARRIRSLDAFAVGADIVYEMLTAARRTTDDALRLVNADVRALPFATGRFDVVWCRLALGHLPDIGSAYAELARVSADEATVVVSDFHAAAARAGHGRSFRDAAGQRRVIEHYVYETHDHERAAARVGLRLVRTLEPVIGPEIRAFYADAERLDAYEAERGLPLVAALQFTR